MQEPTRSTSRTWIPTASIGVDAFMQQRTMPELLAPAGNLERFYTALRYGADAVYLGMQQMSLRNFADNFTMDTLYEACSFAHARQKQVYVTVNAFARDSELKVLPAFLRDVASAGADALIVNDPGVIDVAKEAVAHMPLHLSTQANTLNARAACFWHKQGVSRIVLARELSLEDIRYIRAHTPPTLEFEMFVHGAMCVSYSGRCLLSNYISGRDSNRGECAQPCRWTYELRERKTDGLYYPVEQDALGTYILNSRDLNLLRYLEEVCACGVNSLKIEGRMKSIYYVAGAVNAYRMALDALGAHALTPALLEALEAELQKISHRPFTSGFAFGDPQGAGQQTQQGGYLQTHALSALVLEHRPQDCSVLLEQRNRFFEGDHMDVLSPGDIGRSFTIRNLRTEEGERISSAPHPKQRLLVDCDIPLREGDLLRRPV